MMGPAFLFAFLAMSPKTTVASPWEKVFEVPAHNDWLSSVHVTESEEWFVGGKTGIAWEKSNDRRRNSALFDRPILGLFGEAPASVYAFGPDELILRFDGATWQREHVRSEPKRKGKTDGWLSSAYYAGPSLVVVGPSSMLVRESDGTWRSPTEPQRQKLLAIRLSPPIPRPTACEQAGWQWFDKDRGVLTCHDGRVFLLMNGLWSAKGRLPKSCMTAIDAITLGRGELYAGCGRGTLWATDAAGWRSITAPTAAAEVRSISATARCIYVVDRHSLWRNCGGSP